MRPDILSFNQYNLLATTIFSGPSDVNVLIPPYFVNIYFKLPPLAVRNVYFTLAIKFLFFQDMHSGTFCKILTLLV